MIRLLPEGISVIRTHAQINEYNAEGFRDALDSYKQRVAELAALKCDVIHPEGAPPFMVRGLAAEQEIVKEWEAQYQVPVFTSGMVCAEALRALGVNRFIGFSSFGGPLPEMFVRYYKDAGFDMVSMEVYPEETRSNEDKYRYIKREFLKHDGVQGIYQLGGGGGQLGSMVVALEQDLGVPFVHPIAARVWYVQKRLHVRQPVQGASRLLELMP
jgi:maleate cis-trans isomerase